MRKFILVPAALTLVFSASTALATNGHPSKSYENKAEHGEAYEREIKHIKQEQTKRSLKEQKEQAKQKAQKERKKIAEAKTKNKGPKASQKPVKKPAVAKKEHRHSSGCGHTTTAESVPEINPASGGIALALISGLVAIRRERRKNA